MSHAGCARCEWGASWMQQEPCWHYPGCHARGAHEDKPPDWSAGCHCERCLNELAGYVKALAAWNEAHEGGGAKETTMKRVLPLIIWLAVILVVALALPREAGAGYWTADQQRVIDKIYYWSDWYGADTDLMLRIAYRETRFGVARVGDGGYSIGVFQWYRWGLWQVTPCYAEWGWDGRWNEDADIRCAAWAMSRGYQNHWRPWDWPAGSWLTWLPSPSWGWD